jgi:hypothetical protein
MVTVLPSGIVRIAGSVNGTDFIRDCDEEVVQGLTAEFS